MQTITVTGTATEPSVYDVIIQTGLLEQCGTLLPQAGISPCTAVIVSDDTVATLYADTVQRSLNDAGFRTHTFVFPHGETSKNTATLAQLWEQLAEWQLTRSDILVALGGGVTGDLTGFAAASYLRGIRYVQIPTTLLAMVDSSVGGKTAVDLEQGKNLVGAFWQPSLVIADPNTLNTLPEEVFWDGMAEVIKYGMICHAELAERLQKTPAAPHTDLGSILAACVSVKRDIVHADERDTGMRQLLNFGHTVGHAIERCSGYTISHGHAVAMGMAIITRSAAAQGVCDAKVVDALLCMLHQHNLPSSCPFSADELYNAALTDKKRSGDSLTLVVPYGIGDCRLERIPVTALHDCIEKGLAV